MPPKIPDEVAWQQADLLMQPIFIRVVDNIRKLLDASPWTGTYEHVLIWPADTTQETQALVTLLLQELEAATPESLVEIRQTLSRLPVPHPGYHLCLKRQEQTVNIDMWDMCYQVCFLDYISGEETVAVDTSLIDETGDVDWQRLDVKAHELVERVFAQLPQ